MQTVFQHLVGWGTKLLQERGELIYSFACVRNTESFSIETTLVPLLVEYGFKLRDDVLQFRNIVFS